MNRTDLQRLTRIRLREAKALFDNRHYEGAYYLLGYAVECAFKAYIAKQTKRYDFPDRKFVIDIYTHDLNKLLSVSGLEPEYRKESKRNPNFELNWTIVKDWSEQSRYIAGVSRQRPGIFARQSLAEGVVFCHGYRSGGKGIFVQRNDCCWRRANSAS